MFRTNVGIPDRAIHILPGPELIAPEYVAPDSARPRQMAGPVRTCPPYSLFGTSTLR